MKLSSKSRLLRGVLRALIHTSLVDSPHLSFLCLLPTAAFWSGRLQGTACLNSRFPTSRAATLCVQCQEWWKLGWQWRPQTARLAGQLGQRWRWHQQSVSVATVHCPRFMWNSVSCSHGLKCCFFIQEPYWGGIASSLRAWRFWASECVWKTQGPHGPSSRWILPEDEADQRQGTRGQVLFW